MRPGLYRFTVALRLMFAVGAYVTLQRSRPNAAVGMHALVAITLVNPIFWVLYVAGLVSTYLATR